MKPQKVAIITGAGQGIGLEIARKLLNTGSQVILNDKEVGLTDEAVASLLQMGKGRVLGCSGDSSSLEVISEMVELAMHHFGQLDQVVANAGITLFGNFLDYSLEDFNEVMRVNQMGTFFSDAGSCPGNERSGKRWLNFAHFFCYSTSKSSKPRCLCNEQGSD
ncbi:SDR family NAD(P)-dependent oxidoreductase [Algoriphagus boritolerans]|uniref:SDR family NAD(P)-dependent oxidoreductase n=1 Tax=Algoriphagus boritolerans TaxID=308111 RepID=UPI000AC57F57